MEAISKQIASSSAFYKNITVLKFTYRQGSLSIIIQ